jgi:hypothetical protein
MSTQQFPLQEIEIPEGISLVFSEFHQYDPTNDFTKELNLHFLKEDLFQVTFDEANLVVDMGWYGDHSNNKGEFKIQIIYGSDWDFPITTIFAKSLEEVVDALNRVLLHVASGSMFEQEG